MKIHNYEIVERLGEGAFSIVYKGIHVITKKYVAIKVSRNGGSLKHESKIIAYLNRERVEYVPTLYWYGLYGNNSCIATTYYFKILFKPDSVYKVLTICEQMLRAIHSIHNTGIVHSDLKPDNFMIDERGYIKIIDFGLSSLIFNKDKGVMRENTKTEHLIGSCKYASYYLHMGNLVSFRDDLISLGYIMMWLFGFDLPWSKGAENISCADMLPLYHIAHPENIYRAKLKNIDNLITKNIYLDAYFDMVYKLKYEEIPEYNKYIMLFSNIYL